MPNSPIKEGVWLEVVDSTNDWLKENAYELGDWVQAGLQTNGRGRGSHVWCSPQGNVYLSLLIPKRDYILAQSLVAGIAVIEVCRRHNVPAQVKWPNDICIGDKKLGGILCEVVSQGIIVGVGLNLSGKGLPNIAVSADQWTLSVDPKGWGREIIQNIALWADPLINLGEIENQWLQFWHGADRNWDWGDGIQSARLVALNLANDQACLEINGEKKWVLASQLIENWP